LKARFERQLAEAVSGLGESGRAGPAAGRVDSSSSGPRGVEYVVPESSMRVSERSPAERPDRSEEAEGVDVTPDAFAIIRRRAIEELKRDKDFDRQMRTRGVPWKGVAVALARHLPDELDDRDNEAYRLVRPALNAIYGEGNWDTEARPARRGSGKTTWVVLVGDQSKPEA